MRNLVLALAGAAAVFSIAACDPTEKKDFSCTRSFGDPGVAVDGCIQLHITDVEAVAAQTQCDGDWDDDGCPATAERVDGYCNVPGAAEYTLSGTPARVYFYEPVDRNAAVEACGSIDGTDWVDL